MRLQKDGLDPAKYSHIIDKYSIVLPAEVNDCLHMSSPLADAGTLPEAPSLKLALMVSAWTAAVRGLRCEGLRNCRAAFTCHRFTAIERPRSSWIT